MSKYQVVMEATGGKPVRLLKQLRLVAGLDLRQAKRLAEHLRESAPCALVAEVAQQTAIELADQLRQAGAQVTVQEASIDTPMLCCPDIERPRRWHWLCGPVPITNRD